MRTSRRLAAGLVLAVAITSVGALPTAAQIDPPTPADPSDLTPSDDATVEADDVVEGSKRTSSTLAETDPALLARNDGEVVEVMIKLDYDAIAVYGGGREGLAATSPSVTGEPLDGADATTGAYARQVARDEAAIVADIQAAVPSAEIGQSLRVVYGGVAARIAARDVEAVLAVDGVGAVQTDTVNQLLTDASPSFTGADDVWPQVGGQASAGNGVLFATLDTGVWPEHPSFADTGATPPAPPTNDGQPWQCLFGDNPLTPASDPFVCNDKLVGGRVFMQTHSAQMGPEALYDGLTRDSDGHGTHTATTAAGNALASAPLMGTERGPVSGMAPGAWVAAYKVCGTGGCYSSDSTAAIGRAILDGVDVINFSIGGGADPATDPVELAFLDAYAAGVFVSASAGNSGPGADTVDHLGPWTTTVAATSPNRDFATTLTLSGGAGLTIPGVSISGTGVTSPKPVVLASAPPYNNALCTTPAPPGLFTGKIVACERGPGRVLKSFNVNQGGAAGMILYNSTPFNVSAESHWVPTIHIQDGPALLAHVGANPGLTASFGPGVKTASPGDEIAPFSSRGPGGLTIKPDVGAPGQNILAGHTPTPETASGGPQGEMFRVIDGTSMAAPHVAGAALLVRDAHPDWTPGQIRSALTGAAPAPVTSGGNPATPFDTGSGRIQVDAAVSPGLLLDETAERMFALGLDPANAVHLNLAQVSAPAMPGRVRTTRTVTNPGPAATYSTSTTTGPGTSITVEPSTFTLATGASQVVEIEIATDIAVGQSQFGRIVFTAPSRSSTHLPVSFTVAESEISLTGVGCTPDPVVVPQTSTCSFEVANEGERDGLVDLRAEGDAEATVTGANLGATTAGGVATADDVTLDGYEPGVPDTAPGSAFGYVPLDALGVPTTPIGDEQNINFNVPAFTFGDRTYTRIGINANGYLVVGGTDSAEDTNCCNLTAIGDPARPNNVLAPFWTDLDGGGAPGLLVSVLTDGVAQWIVVEWRVNVFGTNSRRIFQTWIGINGVEDITFTYDPANSAAPFGQPILVGAENRDGAGTTTVAPGTVPGTDMRVTSGAVTPGAVVQWDVTVQGTAEGTGDITVEAASNAHSGVLTTVEQLEVDPEPLPVVTDDPDDVTVDALQTATFTAAATGGTLARWERLPDGSATWETVSGASTTTLSFTARGGDDGSQYRAVFANTSGDEVTTDAAELTVDTLESTTSVSLSPTNPSRGQDVTFTALVAPSTATGTVQFALDATPLGGPVTVTSGQATSAAVPDIPAGPHSVTATYSGDADHDDSGDTETFSVVRNGSSTTIVEITSGVIGEDTPVDATITVVPAPEGGTVQLSVDGVAYGSPLTLDGDGSVETTITGLSPGSRTILAEFSGDDDLDPSDDEVTITVYAAEEAFVRRAYQVMLGRNGDDTGIAYWVDRIEGGLDRTMLIDHFAGSLEGRMRLVGRVYLTALDRSSTADDRAYWAGRVAAGMTAEDLLATLLASSEGIDNAGGTAEGWVEKLFDAHLLREPTTAEVDYWVGRAEATNTIVQVRQLAKQFGRMPEATTVALSEAARLVCGVTTIPSGIADQLRTRWVTFGRHPVRLAGDTLALLCPSSSAPPT